MLAAMQGISREILETAKMDGAGPLVSFFFVTIPAILALRGFSIINLIALFGGVILLDRGNIV